MSTAVVVHLRSGAIRCGGCRQGWTCGVFSPLYSLSSFLVNIPSGVVDAGVGCRDVLASIEPRSHVSFVHVVDVDWFNVNFFINFLRIHQWIIKGGFFVL